MFNLSRSKHYLALSQRLRTSSSSHINLMSTKNTKGPVITKEQMKNEMLEHDYFDTEILYHGMKNTRTDDHKRSEKDLLDEQSLKEALEQVKQEVASSGEKEYKIMTIQPGAWKKVQFYKKSLFFLNLPLIVGIPVFVEFGLP